MAMRKGLGKGLGALIEDFNEQPNTPGEGAVTLPLQKIDQIPFSREKPSTLKNWIPWRIPSACTALSSR